MAHREGTPSRRTLLQALGVIGAAVLAPATVDARRKRRRGALGATSTPADKGVIVYRFATRRSFSCRACQVHHRYKLFSTHALANANRAHPGCNCPIVTQRISKKKARQLFAVTPGVVDLRFVGGRP
jgi:hypothetical protein